MSDTLADLASWFPSEFLTADHIPINKTHLLNNHHNSHPYPFDFGSSSSTESESDDDDHLAGLTYRFTRSVSLQERLKIPYPVQKRVFSSSPESAFNWNVSRPTHVHSSPATPLVHSDEDSWKRIYAAAAGQIARMKMNKNLNIINANDGVFANRNFLRDPRPHGAPLPSHYNHPNCSPRMCANEEFFRQQQFHHTVNYGGCGGWCGTNRLVWQPQVENPRLQQPANAFFVKPVVAGSGFAGVKKECAGTGVFLPRTSFSDAPLELQKKTACSGSHLPAKVLQSFNKTMDPINPQPQPNIYSGFSPHNQVPPHHFNRAELAEIVMARRHAEMLAQQRRSTKEAQIGGHPEVVLPQEWTY